MPDYCAAKPEQGFLKFSKSRPRLTIRLFLVSWAVEYWGCLVLYDHEGSYFVLGRARGERSRCGRAAPFPYRTKRCIEYR